MSEEMSGGKPEGKGLAVGGFVLSLVGTIFAPIIAGIVVLSMAATFAETGEVGGKGLMYFWVVLCLGSVAMSAMGMMKLGKTGGKKGLAIAGLVIGIVGTIWSVMLLMGLDVVQGGAEGSVDALNRLENMSN
jgi:hypothetical protein